MSAAAALNASRILPAYRGHLLWLLLPDGSPLSVNVVGIAHAGIQVIKLGPKQLAFAFLAFGTDGTTAVWDPRSGEWKEAKP